MSVNDRRALNTAYLIRLRLSPACSDHHSRHERQLDSTIPFHYSTWTVDANTHPIGCRITIMPPSTAAAFPSVPMTYYLLAEFAAQPRSSPIPRPPDLDELQHMLISLNALNNSASRRAKIAAEGIRIGRESLARSNYAWKLDEGENKGKRGRVKEEEGKRGVLGRPGMAEGRRKEASVNGVAKVKRELSGMFRPTRQSRASLASQSANRADLSVSASPAPTSASEYARPSSRLGTPADIPASDRTNLKQKKRKLAHLAGGSPEADTASVSSYRGRAGSSTREGSVSAGVERISAVPVTGAFVGSTGGTPGGTPGADRAAWVSQAVPSGLKVKLSLSNSGKVGTDNGSRYLLLKCPPAEPFVPASNGFATTLPIPNDTDKPYRLCRSATRQL